jgi:hypothetical protein
MFLIPYETQANRYGFAWLVEWRTGNRLGPTST